jgi:hypothetical protein
MVEVKNHSAASNVISPKPAMMNSDHLLRHLACDIVRTLPRLLGCQSGGEIVSLPIPIDRETRPALQISTDATSPAPRPVKIEMAHAIRRGGA